MQHMQTDGPAIARCLRGAEAFNRLDADALMPADGQVYRLLTCRCGAVKLCYSWMRSRVSRIHELGLHRLPDLSTRGGGSSLLWTTEKAPWEPATSETFELFALPAETDCCCFASPVPEINSCFGAIGSCCSLTRMVSRSIADRCALNLATFSPSRMRPPALAKGCAAFHSWLRRWCHACQPCSLTRANLSQFREADAAVDGGPLWSRPLPWLLRLRTGSAPCGSIACPASGGDNVSPALLRCDAVSDEPDTGACDDGGHRRNKGQQWLFAQAVPRAYALKRITERSSAHCKA